MQRLVITCVLAFGGVAAAQPQQQPYYQPPQQGYPPQQPYPYNYPPPQGYPPPAQYVYPPPRTEIMKPPKLVLATPNEAAAASTWACADALDRHRPDLARKLCGEALAKDDKLPFAHLLLSQAEQPDLARKELQQAVELSRRASPGERYFVEAWRMQMLGNAAEARRMYDALVGALPGEPRAFLARGRFRQSVIGDIDGAIADYRHASSLDPKWPNAPAAFALALLERGQLDEALAAAKRTAELAPTEPDAQLTLARVALRRGDLAEAVAAARRAVAGDDKFTSAQAALGDALLFSGKGKDARRAYGQLIGNDYPDVHHEGAMREARSWAFEARPGEAEKSLAAEADTAEKTKRPGDEADARIELARLQLDRGAVSEAGQSLRQVDEVLQRDGGALGDDERRKLHAEGLQVRAMVLAAIGERGTAEARADEMGAALQAALDPRAAEKSTALKGWIAARNHDDRSALMDLAVASRPTFRMALALALQRSGDLPRARAIMEELARRNENDLEGALTRPRAVAWLKTTR